VVEDRQGIGRKGRLKASIHLTPAWLDGALRAAGVLENGEKL
jgi:hypothetical protein